MCGISSLFPSGRRQKVSHVHLPSSSQFQSGLPRSLYVLPMILPKDEKQDSREYGSLMRSEAEPAVGGGIFAGGTFAGSAVVGWDNDVLVDLRGSKGGGER